jgi:GT2 family glycosyltransferase
MSQGTVAVVVPTCNRRELLLQTVKSVLAQTYGDLRCIVVDNGSTDGTTEALASLGDNRLSWVRRELRAGAAAARNLGIDAAGGSPWVAFLDDDDLWAPEKLELQLAALAANPAARWSATGCQYVDADLRVLPTESFHWGALPDQTTTLVHQEQLFGMLREHNDLKMSTSTVLAPRELLIAAGKFNATLLLAEDWDLWLRLIQRSPFVYVDLPLQVYRVWEGQTSNESSRSWPAIRSSILALRARYLAPDDASVSREQAATWEQHAARLCVADNRRAKASGHYLRAAWKGRDPGQLAYALAVVTVPSVVKGRLGRATQSREADVDIPPAWAGQVEQWLELYRQRAGSAPPLT